MKRKITDLSTSERMVTLDALYTAAGSVKGRVAMKTFLRDLLTESERIMLGRRILIARLILSGKTDLDVARELRVGADTVWRVKKWLRDQIPGYEKAIAELENEYRQREKKRTAPKFGTFAYLKKKYPLHFLFFPPFK